jgi:nitrate reductase gamma subunit
MSYFFAVIIPYSAAIIFLAGVVFRVARWASTPVPFRISTACGQQKSFPWIKNSRLDNPYSLPGVMGRMALEILLFRSLFRNTRTDLRPGPAFISGSAKWLWLGSLAFHWSLLIIVLRHLRFFTGSEPRWIAFIQNLDGFFQVGMPVVFATNAVLPAALAFLFFRRIVDSKLRYISLLADYIPLLLIGAIAVTGILLRHIYKVDLRHVKGLVMDLILLRPSAPVGIGILFYVHLLFACLLLAYFPFSKLMHIGGILLSPTRNLANNSRMRRHINPWNYDVKVHTYEEYEDEFRPLMIEAGLPVEKTEQKQVEGADQT